VYGQTGSGKTYSMMGPNENLTGFCNDKNLKGLIPRVVDSLFESVETSDINLEFTISVQYIEIYMEKIKDLLDSMKCFHF
jgi:kinesin family protein 5